MQNSKRPSVIFSNYDDLNNPYYGGGGAIAIHEIAKRLTQKYDITVITGKYPSSHDAILDKVQYKRIGLENAGPKLGQIIFQIILPFYVFRSNFNLWIESFTPPFSTSFLQLFSKKPVIGLAHMLSSEDMRRKYKLRFDLVERIGLRTYRNFITITEAVKKKILQANPNAEIQVIPNGVNLSEVNKRKNHLGKHILYLGRIEINQKGLDLLLNAYSHIHNKTDYDLSIAGSGATTDLNKLRKIIKKLKIEKRVKLLGRVSGKAKENLLLNSSLIIIPSRFETFSMVALEAMAYGLPIITFDIEGLSWMPEHSRIKVNPFDSMELAKAMMELSQNYELAKKMKLIGIKYAKANTWGKIAKQYSKFFESIM